MGLAKPNLIFNQTRSCKYCNRILENSSKTPIDAATSRLPVNAKDIIVVVVVAVNRQDNTFAILRRLDSFTTLSFLN